MRTIHRTADCRDLTVCASAVRAYASETGTPWFVMTGAARRRQGRRAERA
jgi:hypothetical protein